MGNVVASYNRITAARLLRHIGQGSNYGQANSSISSMEDTIASLSNLCTGDFNVYARLGLYDYCWVLVWGLFGWKIRYRVIYCSPAVNSSINCRRNFDNFLWPFRHISHNERKSSNPKPIRTTSSEQIDCSGICQQFLLPLLHCVHQTRYENASESAHDTNAYSSGWLRNQSNAMHLIKHLYSFHLPPSSSLLVRTKCPRVFAAKIETEIRSVVLLWWRFIQQTKNGRWWRWSQELCIAVWGPQPFWIGSRWFETETSNEKLFLLFKVATREEFLFLFPHTKNNQNHRRFEKVPKTSTTHMTIIWNCTFSSVMSFSSHRSLHLLRSGLYWIIFSKFAWMLTRYGMMMMYMRNNSVMTRE